MKMRLLVYTAIAGLVFGAGSANAQRVEQDSTSTSPLAGLIETWQQRILAENLPVPDAKNWALRNMAKFSSLTPERIELVQQATSLGELEALLTVAPIPEGTNLGLLLGTKPGNISSTMPQDKNNPGSAPAMYADLVFTAVNPCRIYDSRPSQGGPGTWLANNSYIISVGPYSSYAFEGGSATSCGLTANAGSGEIAAIMVSATSVSQTTQGYLTFYSEVNPAPYGVSQFFQAGVVQTSFVVMPTDLIGGVWTYGYIKNANADVILDVVGYFAKPRAAALQCVDVVGTPATAAAGSTNTSANLPACTAGYSFITAYCNTNSNQTLILGINSGACYFNNATGGAATVTATAHCCRTAGR